jgi:hypothetical protein
MATYKHLRSSTASKRPTTGIADGQLAINTNTASPGLFFKDSAGTGIVKVGPVHVGATAPNASPAAGGSTGNYTGEQWLDTSVSPAQMKVWNGSAWVGIVADELPVSKLQDGAARQLLQTDAAGTGVEWTSNVDVPGTLDVTSTATFDSIALHPLGSAAAPTLTFTGDPNTGIYSPGADQVAVATNGTGRLFVDSSGRVGVGVTPSSTLFHVYTSAPSTISAPTICLEGGTNAYGAGVDFASRTSAGGTLVSMAKITADGEAPWNTTASTQDAGLRFFTAADGSLSERLRITSAGLVGIGTSSPSQRLHVVGTVQSLSTSTTVADNVGFFAGNGGDGSLLNGITFQGSYISNLYLGRSASADDLVVRNGSAELVRVTNAGRLGIGTTSPLAKLAVEYSVAGVGSEGVRLSDTTNSTVSLFGTTETSYSYAGVTGHNTIFYGARDIAICADNANNGQIKFATGGSEAFRVDSSRRLLVGTASARDNYFNTSGLGGLLQVEGANSQAQRVVSNTYGIASGAGPIVVLAKHRSNSIGGNTVVQSGDYCGELSFQGSDGTEFVELANIAGVVDGTPGANDMPGRLVFSTTADGASSPTERMRISNNGTVLISCTSFPSATVKGVGWANNSGVGYYYSSAVSITGSSAHAQFINPNGIVGSITTDASATAYNTSSDYRLKENVFAVTDGITRLQQLKPSRFNFITDPDKTVDGFIAHEVQEVVPEAITGEKDAEDANGNPKYQGIDQSKLVPLLTAALQEAIGEIESLKARVTALESA